MDTSGREVLDCSARRHLVLGMLAAPLACRSRAAGAEDTAEAAVPAPSPALLASARTFGAAPEWGGLEVKMLGEPGLDGRGGTAIVLLHGWAAPGDEMLGLAGRLARPGVRFFAPVGPQPPAGAPRGRAWWNVYGADIPKMPWDGVMPASYRPNTQMTAARAAVHAVLKTIRTRIVPDELFIAGFSQGAMLALDVALTAEQPLDRAAGLSAVLVPESLEALRAPRPPRTPQTAFFLSHGRRDAILGFNGGERARKLLEQHGYPVTFEAFDGGHEIPKSVVSALGRFFFD